MSSRLKIIYSLLLLVVFAGAGITYYAISSGKIAPKAAESPWYSLLSNVNVTNSGFTINTKSALLSNYQVNCGLNTGCQVSKSGTAGSLSFSNQLFKVSPSGELSVQPIASPTFGSTNVLNPPCNGSWKKTSKSMTGTKKTYVWECK